MTTEDGTVYKGRMFIDGSYEGEFVVASGIPYAKGRESRQHYGESLAGVLGASGTKLAYPKRLFPSAPGVDPFVQPHSSPPQLLPNIYPEVSLAPEGGADDAVMTFEFRPCLTAVPANRVPILTPGTYDPARFEVETSRLIACTSIGIFFALLAL